MKIRADPIVVELYKSFAQVSKELAESATDKILSRLSPPLKPSLTFKQSKLVISKLGGISASNTNPFDSFKNASDEMTEETYSKSYPEPTVKQIKL
jgi:hypothetical protein